MGGTTQIAKQAVSSNPDRTPGDIEELVEKITSSLIMGTSLHSAVVGASEARDVGLPVRELPLQSKQWQDIWQLWTRYFTIGPLDELSVYESEHASQILHYSASQQ